MTTRPKAIRRPICPVLCEVNPGIHQRDVSVIWDLAPHDFSILSACVGHGASDVAFINLRFPSGVLAELQLSWLSPIKLRRTIVVGSKMMLLYDDTNSAEPIKIYNHGVAYCEPGSFGEFQLSYRTGVY